MSDPEHELDALRRRAYSRSGTADDLRRLAELEPTPGDRRDESPVRHDPPAQERIDPGHDDPPEPGRIAPRRRPVLIAATAGVVAGATIATLGILLPRADDPAIEPIPRAATALAIFDRAPTERDDPTRLVMTLAHIRPGELENAELRWLGDVAEHEVYVARGTYAGIVKICLISARVDSTAAACTDQSEFEFSGLNVGDGSLELRWGPLGTEIWVADHTD